MLVAGGLLLLNCIGRGHNGFMDYRNEVGFPWPYFGFDLNPDKDGVVLFSGLILDLIFCLGVLGATCYAWEYPLRLRRFRRCEGAMSDEQKPKRRFWQIHLSTVFLLNFICAVFLYIETRPVSAHVMLVDNHRSGSVALNSWVGIAYGWPWHYECSAPFITFTEIRSYFALVADIAIILVMLLIFAVVVEFLIRRSEGRKA